MTTLLQRVIILAVAMWGSAQAAHDGALGERSEGDFAILVDLKNKARVFGLGDFTITPKSLSPHRAICIYANTENFTINATSGNGKYELLQDGVQVGIPYSLELFANKEATGAAVKKWGSSSKSVDAIVPRRALDDTDDEINDSCKIGNFSLKVSAELKRGLSPGAYTDLVTLLVTPQ